MCYNIFHNNFRHIILCTSPTCQFIFANEGAIVKYYLAINGSKYLNNLIGIESISLHTMFTESLSIRPCYIDFITTNRSERIEEDK